MEEKETNTIEIEDAPAPEAVVAPATPSVEELKEDGWTPEEIKSAEEKGMIYTPEGEKKEEEKGEEKKEDEKPADEKKEDEKPKQKGGLPDMTMNPEQEKWFLENFPKGTPNRAFYFRAKNERQTRQKAEARTKELETELRVLKENASVKPPEPLVDEFGNEVDPKDLPLTEKRLGELKVAEAEQDRKDREVFDKKQELVSSAQVSQEEYARELYEDFDHSIGKAKEVMTNLETLIPQKHLQGKAVRLINDLRKAAARADELGLDDNHAAFIAYELGQLHPDYATKIDDGAIVPKGSTQDPKVDGDLTPDKMERIEKNTQRRASSASISGGGGKRVISVDDVDLETLNNFSSEKRNAFRENHPDQYKKLLRG